VPDDPRDDREMESCGGATKTTELLEKSSAGQVVFLLARGSNKLHMISDRKSGASYSDYLVQGFGLRFGERESEAQAERRRKRSPCGTTVAEPQARPSVTSPLVFAGPATLQITSGGSVSHAVLGVKIRTTTIASPGMCWVLVCRYCGSGNWHLPYGVHPVRRCFPRGNKYVVVKE